MPKVKILSPDVISKIAAGEVIERPASVVKELIENSLDAKATSIELHLEDAGKKLIRLKDSGTGIAKEDIETLFQRHATSKIQNFDDLFSIHSLGFRGEALYSIAAIADVILRSKAGAVAEENKLNAPRSTPNATNGWEIHLRGGERLSLKPDAIPLGTEIEVKELFFNTPARRKFLKSNLSEVNQVLGVFTPYTLLYPQCRFLLTHGDKVLIDLTPADKLVSRVAAALNLEEKNILEARQSFPEANITAHLLLGDINITRARRDLQFLFVNGRPVQSKAIGFHMNEAFRLILPPHQFPFFVVYLTLPPENVDVNIHPAKREVKIKDEQSLCSLLRQMTEQVLMGRGSAKQAKGFSQTGSAFPLPGISAAPMHAERLSETFDSPLERNLVNRPTEENTFPQQNVSPQAMENLFGPNTKGRQPDGLPERLRTATFVGMFANKFLLFESGHDLLIIDQHAAQERITFESLIRQMDKGNVEIQQMLSPIIIKLPVADMLVWEEAKNIFEELGFSCTQFDKEAVAVHSYPALIKDPERSFKDILAGENPARCDHEALARRACRGSVMAGDPLTLQQAQYIRGALLACRDPFICPHGRPTLIQLSEGFLDKQFLRT